MLNILYLGRDAAAETELKAVLEDGGYSIENCICRIDRMGLMGSITKDRPDVILINCYGDDYDSGLNAELLHVIREADSAIQIILLIEKHSREATLISLEYDVEWILSTDGELDLLPKVLRRVDRKLQLTQQMHQEQTQRLFINYLHNEYQLSEAERRELFRDVKPGDFFQVCIIKAMPPYRRQVMTDQQNLVSMKGHSILANRLSKLKGYYLARDDLNWVICLRGTRAELEQGKHQLEQFLRDMREFDQRHTHCAAWVFLGSVQQGLHGIAKSYRTADVLRNERLFRPNIDIIEEKSEYANPLHGQERYQVFDVRKAMGNALESFDKLTAQKALKQLKSNILSATDFCGDEMFSIYKTLISTLYQEMERQEVDLREKGMDYEMEIREFDLFWNITDVFSSLEASFLKGMSLLKEIEENSMSAPIVLAKRYIRSYFNMPLTLKEISDYVGMNENYFSDCFSKATKMTFKQYQTDLRIRYAKQMLLDKQYSMEDVADAVGYNDVKYFSRVFKLVAGMAPGEYRKKYHVVRD